MATRMQQRRGTAAQWISTNAGAGPVLNSGEIGWESDTNKFKIGDGINNWSSLDYFIDGNSTANPAFGSSITFEGATANDFETTVAVTDPTADRTITLPDATGTVVLADGSGNITVSGNLTVSGTTTTINSTTINATTGIVFEGATANDFETTLTVTDPTADRTITFPDDGGTVQLRVTDVSDTEIGYLNGVTSAIQTQLDDKSTASKTETLTNKSISLGSNTVTSTLAQLNTAVTDADVASLAGTETLTNKSISLTTNTVTGTKAEFNSAMSDADFATLAGTETLTNKTLTSPTVSGLYISDSSIVIEGSSDNEFETTLSFTNPTTDKTFTFPDSTGTVATQEYVDSTVSGAEVDQSTLAGTGISWNAGENQFDVNTSVIQARVADVSDTEIGYLNGVTSAIQTQLDAKSSFEGVLTTSSLVVNNIYDDAVADDIDTSVVLTVNNAKSFKNGQYVRVFGTIIDGTPVADFTGTLADFYGVINVDGNTITVYTEPENTTLNYYTGSTINQAQVVLSSMDPYLYQKKITNATETEIGYLSGVTSAIQTQLDAKAALSGATFTGAVSGTDLTLSGNLTVNGTTTNINSTNLVVEDKNVVLGDTTTPTDITADGGGITLKGTTDKTFNWVDATDAWTSSEHVNLVSGKELKINGTSVLSGSTLGSGVTASSLTSVGTITSGTWTGTAIAIANGGTGATTASTAAAALLPAQTSNSGKYLTTDGSGTLSWGTVSGYSAPTLGSTSIASGATVTTIAGLTLTAPELGAATATSINTLTVGKGGSSVETNTAVGATALAANTMGDNTSAFGYQALTANTTGDYNTALGAYALATNTTGQLNVSVGTNAMQYNVTGNDNIAVGHEALLYQVGGHKNTAIGSFAMYNNDVEDENTAIGHSALYMFGQNGTTTGGTANTALGYSALQNLMSGSYNVGLGKWAGDTLATGSNNIIIGYNADVSADEVSNEITLGNASITRFRIPGLELDTNTATNGQLLGWNDSTGKFAWITPAAGAAFSEFMLIGA